MPTFLFEDYIIPIIKSRRLGRSLGINLLPKNFKLCNFDCIYCECGWNIKGRKVMLPSIDIISNMVEKKLLDLKELNERFDSITFAGNGEPTMHPEFLNIVKNVIELRNRIFPQVKITILSNGIFIDKKDIFEAYSLVDNPILKLDAGTQKMLTIINQPNSKKHIDYITNEYKKFSSKIIIQTLFLKGEKEGIKFDNTEDFEIKEWINKIKYISPKSVMIYTLDRDTPLDKLEKIPIDKLEEISKKINELGINCDYY